MAKIGRNAPCPCGSGKKWKKCHGSPDAEAAMSQMYEGFDVIQECKEGDFSSVSEHVPELIEDLINFSFEGVVIGASGLAAIAENHTHILRLDCLIHLAAVHAKGRQTPTAIDFKRWLNRQLRNSPIFQLEDPPEDFAIGNVCTALGNRRIFNGDDSHSDYYLQDLLDALNAAPSRFNLLREQCGAVLLLSDRLADRHGYSRNTSGNAGGAEDVSIPASGDILGWAEHSLFTPGALASDGIEVSLLRPFTRSTGDLSEAASHERVMRPRRFPLLWVGDSVLIAFPTSIAMAITEHVLEAVSEQGMLRSLHRALMRVQQERALRPTTLSLEDGASETGKLPTRYTPPSEYVTEGAFRFGVTKHLHIIFLHDDLASVLRDGIDAVWKPKFGLDLARHIEQSAHALASEADYSGGLTLLVIGGIWRGFEIASAHNLPVNWSLQAWSSADLDYLVATESKWKLMLWKCSMLRKQLESMGVTFVGVHSDAHLFSYWRNLRFRLLPEGIPPELPLGVGIGVSEILSLRGDGRRRLDEHCLLRPDTGQWMRVLRVNPHSYFKEDNEQPIYGAPSEALEGRLSGAVETSRRAWWIQCRSGGATTFQRHYVYKVWEVALNWLARLAPTLDELLPELNAGNILVELDLSAIAGNERWEADAIANLSDISECPVSAGDGVMRIVVPVEFLKELGQVRNIAERRLIEALVIGAISLASGSDRAVRYQGIMTELAVSDDQRYMHAFRVDDARDHLREFDSGQPHLLEIEDVAPGSLAIAGEAGLPYPSSITGKDECNLALNQLVDAYWARCRECLKLLNRASVVSWCLLNQERALCELDEWRRTSRAVMALHRDREDVLRASQVRRAARDRTQITNRVAVEMAICTSPVDGGRTASQGDLNYLCGQIAHLISAANQSDAVRAGAEAPILEISALGEIDFRRNLESLVTPYFTSAFEKEHIGDVRNYEEFFEDKEHGTKTDEQVFGEAFVDAFRTEFGISPGRLALLGVVLTEGAIKLETIVVQKTQKSFKELMEEQGFTNDEINGFFRSFVSNPRERWNSAQRPFRGKDWWPWRFNRRLSLMTRPVVAITDVALIYAPGFCEDSFRHVVMSCFKGSFETEYFDSVAMREYVGRENARRGHEFNEAVGDIFRKAGWSARTEVQMSELGAPEEEAPGDIDVLAWKNGVVCVCECKELWFARTIGQIVEQLSRFRGKEGDDLFKHLRRAEWVRANPACLSRVIGSSAFQMRSLLITSKIVPMQFVSGLDVEVIDADRLPESI